MSPQKNEENYVQKLEIAIYQRCYFNYNNSKKLIWSIFRIRKCIVQLNICFVLFKSILLTIFDVNNQHISMCVFAKVSNSLQNIHFPIRENILQYYKRYLLNDIQELSGLGNPLISTWFLWKCSKYIYHLCSDISIKLLVLLEVYYSNFLWSNKILQVLEITNVMF